MYYIIETPDQFEKFQQYDLSTSIVDIVPLNDCYHSILSSICLVYIRPLRSKSGFILPVNHAESLSVGYQAISRLLRDSVDQIYAVDAKRIKYYLKRNKGLFCLKTALYLKEGLHLTESDYYTTAHKYFYQRYSSDCEVNRIIPISKHYEKLEAISTSLMKCMKVVDEPYYNLYGKIAPEVFYRIEKEGIKLDLQEYQKHYNVKDPKASTFQDLIYTAYSIYTSTGRPSNAFNGVNFAALNKEDDTRKAIIPKNDYLIEYDYSSYHLRILCNLIEYKFEEDDIHRHIGRFYYEKEVLSEKEYSDSKQLTFRLLYTDSDISEVNTIPFFNKVREFKKTLWQQYVKNGYINSYYSGRPIKNIESKTQLLPYVLQNYETERNIEVLHRLIRYLKNKKTKLILYCYDSFLLDYSKSDGKDALVDIESILEDGGYPTSCKYGKNYQNLNNF